MLQCFTRIGYDVVGISDKDFRHGLDFLTEMSNQHQLTFVSSNLFYQDSNQPIFERYKILKKAGIKVGVFGLTDEMFWRNKAHIDTMGIEIHSYRDVCAEMVEKLRPKVHYLVMLTDLRQKSLDTLIAHNPGIDFVMTTGSYSTQTRRLDIAPTLIVGTGHRGQSGEMVEIPFDPQNPDTVVFHEAHKQLTDAVGVDSLMADLITECNPKPTPKRRTQKQRGQNTALTGKDPSKVSDTKEKQPVRKSPYQGPGVHPPQNQINSDQPKPQTGG
jgi:2',3'-cyclic-nucleotide 2'-phosphodiesterase (5'-nucleotidase family)